MIRELKALGIDVYFERENIHSLSADGELMLTLLASFAEEESRSASGNMKWRIQTMFERGELWGAINLYGYRMIDGKLSIVPEEAEGIRLAAKYYLEGDGDTQIRRKLTEAGYSSKHGLEIQGGVLRRSIVNEKLAGDALLQKFYIDDPITKKVMQNQGELPQYMVKNSHEPILDRETYDRVLAEHERRKAKYQPAPSPRKTYPFSGLIVCGLCGARFRRKIAGSAPKYKKPVWICDTFNQHGKSCCASRQIPESILMGLAADVLETPVFDSSSFTDTIREIHVPAVNRLVFHFHDGRQVARVWENKSRSQSWTDDMRQRQREQSMERSRQ